MNELDFLCLMLILILGKETYMHFHGSEMLFSVDVITVVNYVFNIVFL